MNEHAHKSPTTHADIIAECASIYTSQDVEVRDCQIDVLHDDGCSRGWNNETTVDGTCGHTFDIVNILYACQNFTRRCPNGPHAHVSMWGKKTSETEYSLYAD